MESRTHPSLMKLKKHQNTLQLKMHGQHNPHLNFGGRTLVGVFVVYILKKAPKIGGLQQLAAAPKVLGFLFTLFESGLNLKPRAVRITFSSPKVLCFRSLVQLIKSVYGEEDNNSDYGDFKKTG